MNLTDYPAQEPLSEFGQRHHQGMARRNPQLLSTEHAYALDCPQRRLLFFPAAVSDAPLLVFFHGGGWTNGFKEYAAFMGPLFAQAGIAFATAGYRLAPGHVFPTGWLDCADAVRWCWEARERLGVAGGRFFVGGFSAGAHYASLLATRTDWMAPRGLAPELLRGCLAVSGSYRFDAQAGFAARPRFLGAPESGNDIAAAPLAHVRAGVAPFHVSWGEHDFPHLVRQARELADALARAQGDVTCLEIPGRDHLGAGYAAGEYDGPWFAAAASWIKARAR